MNIEAAFVRSAAGANAFPADGLPEIALVGRSNVGKSSLINALVRQKIARTSGSPGKTRLANIYRVARSSPFYLVDLPGYGYARGGTESAREFKELTRAYFGQVRQVGRVRQVGKSTSSPGSPTPPGPPALVSALLLIDSRHIGLANDVDAWRWLKEAVATSAIVATKIDKLARGERIRAMGLAESVFEDSVLPVSAATGEGLDELWKLIDSLVNSRKPAADSRAITPKETAHRRGKNR